MARSRTVQIAVQGISPGEGVTSVINHLRGKPFEIHQSTIGVEYQTLNLNGVKLEIWDLNSQTQARSMLFDYFCKTEMAILCVRAEKIAKDSDSCHSELQKIKEFIEAIKEYRQEKFALEQPGLQQQSELKMILTITQFDLIDGELERRFLRAAVSELQTQHPNVSVCVCSAKTGVGFDKLGLAISSHLLYQPEKIQSKLFPPSPKPSPKHKESTLTVESFSVPRSGYPASSGNNA